MKIPKSFKLLGHTIEVIEEPAGFYENNRYGACNYEGKWIKLAPPAPSHPVTQGSFEHTFLHELVHMVFYHTEQSGLNKNEDFVDLVAGLLHQALTTMEYDSPAIQPPKQYSEVITV